MTDGRTYAEVSEQVLNFFEQSGFRVSPSSRIARMKRALVDSNGNARFIIPSDKNSYVAAQQAIREFQQMLFIIERIGKRCHEKEFYFRFKNLISDNVHPTSDPINSPGRDFQCELYFFAVCENAGLSPAWSEPDIICPLNTSPMGIAVKRIKNIDAFDENFNEAAKQIYKSRMTGVIAMDLSLARNPTDYMSDQIIESRRLDMASKVWVQRFVSSRFEKIVEMSRHRWVSGLVLVFHDRCIEHGGRPILISLSFSVELSDNRRRVSEFNDFFKAFVCGLPTEVES